MTAEIEQSQSKKLKSALEDVYEAVAALEGALDVAEAKDEPGLPENAGRRWDWEEDVSLVRGYMNRLSIDELAERHGRTATSILWRLLKYANFEDLSPSGSDLEDADPEGGRENHADADEISISDISEKISDFLKFLTNQVNENELLSANGGSE